MIKPYWSILTKKLKNNHTIKTGLTIPYLFGAYSVLGYKPASIHDLLILILDSPADDFPVLEKCDVIMHDVLKLEARSEANRKRKNEFKIRSSSSDNALFISYNSNLGNTFAKVCASLSGLYQFPIDNMLYSWDNKNKTWTRFEKTEIEIIKSIN